MSAPTLSWEAIETLLPRIARAVAQSDSTYHALMDIAPLATYAAVERSVMACRVSSSDWGLSFKIDRQYPLALRLGRVLQEAVESELEQYVQVTTHL